MLFVIITIIIMRSSCHRRTDIGYDNLIFFYVPGQTIVVVTMTWILRRLRVFSQIQL